MQITLRPLFQNVALYSRHLLQDKEYRQAVVMNKLLNFVEWHYENESFPGAPTLGAALFQEGQRGQAETLNTGLFCR